MTFDAIKITISDRRKIYFLKVSIPKDRVTFSEKKMKQLRYKTVVKEVAFHNFF